MLYSCSYPKSIKSSFWHVERVYWKESLKYEKKPPTNHFFVRNKVLYGQGKIAIFFAQNHLIGCYWNVAPAIMECSHVNVMHFGLYSYLISGLWFFFYRKLRKINQKYSRANRLGCFLMYVIIKLKINNIIFQGFFSFNAINSELWNFTNSSGIVLSIELKA